MDITSTCHHSQIQLSRLFLSNFVNFVLFFFFFNTSRLIFVSVELSYQMQPTPTICIARTISYRTCTYTLIQKTTCIPKKKIYTRNKLQSMTTCWQRAYLSYILFGLLFLHLFLYLTSRVGYGVSKVMASVVRLLLLPPNVDSSHTENGRAAQILNESANRLRPAE